VIAGALTQRVTRTVVAIRERVDDEIRSGLRRAQDHVDEKEGRHSKQERGEEQAEISGNRFHCSRRFSGRSTGFARQSAAKSVASSSAEFPFLNMRSPGSGTHWPLQAAANFKS